ncbi:hypothetical protein [Klebsiella sp. PL-2018]|uniref:hypothetical protein n=1 Tax=Klebsiella TaxID=570 RepID=UPI001C215952|nr:hypothetical protein [Klebsiella sp. PL-2018]
MIGLLIFIFSLVLLGPVMFVICLLTPWRGFRLATARRHRRRYITLHLSSFDRVGHLDRVRARLFHDSFLAAMEKALAHRERPVFFVSHLLRPSHRRSLRDMMSSRYPERRWRCRQIPLRRSVRYAIRIQMLLQEWRWITVPDTAWLVVVRPESPSATPPGPASRPDDCPGRFSDSSAAGHDVLHAGSASPEWLHPSQHGGNGRHQPHFRSRLSRI